MQHMKASAEKLRAEAEYADQIARSATDDKKRELYENLAGHFRRLAEEFEKAIVARTEKTAMPWTGCHVLLTPTRPAARTLHHGQRGARSAPKARGHAP
jgi:hypothetical protein